MSTTFRDAPVSSTLANVFLLKKRKEDLNPVARNFQEGKHKIFNIVNFSCQVFFPPRRNNFLRQGGAGHGNDEENVKQEEWSLFWTHRMHLGFFGCGSMVEGAVGGVRLNMDQGQHQQLSKLLLVCGLMTKNNNELQLHKSEIDYICNATYTKPN